MNHCSLSKEGMGGGGKSRGIRWGGWILLAFFVTTHPSKNHVFHHNLLSPPIQSKTTNPNGRSENQGGDLTQKVLESVLRQAYDRWHDMPLEHQLTLVVIGFDQRNEDIAKLAWKLFYSHRDEFDYLIRDAIFLYVLFGLHENLKNLAWEALQDYTIYLGDEYPDRDGFINLFPPPEGTSDERRIRHFVDLARWVSTYRIHHELIRDFGTAGETGLVSFLRDSVSEENTGSSQGQDRELDVLLQRGRIKQVLETIQRQSANLDDGINSLIGSSSTGNRNNTSLEAFL